MTNAKKLAWKTGMAVLQIMGRKKQVSTSVVIGESENGKLVEMLFNLDDNDFTTSLNLDKKAINVLFQEYFLNQSFKKNMSMDNAHIYYPEEQGLNLLLVCVLDIMFNSDNN